MKISRHFWRGLFFLWLIAVFCSGLVQPARNVPVRAAPGYQEQVCSLTLAQWTFENLTPNPNTSPNYSYIATDVTLATAAAGTGLASPTISASPKSWYASGFATGTTLDPTNNDYFQFAVDTTNYSGVNLSFNALRSAQGPTSMQVHYSTDGTNFNALADTYTVGASNPSSPFVANLAGLTNAAGNTYIRIYGWNSAAAGGTGRIDDVTFTGCQPATPTATPTDTGTPTSTYTPTDTGTPTNTGTATTTGTSTSTATNTPSGTPTSVVISEFRTSGPRGANDEFIELYNPTPAAIDISGWKISASNNSGNTSVRATIPPSTILRSGQYYLVANTSVSDGYSNPNLPPNLAYGVAISDNGGIALLRANDTPVDQVGMHANSAYKEGDILSPLNGMNESYERKSNNCQDTNNNNNDFVKAASSPHNYSSPLSLCGIAGPTLIGTTTTITADNPDPSLVNGTVTVSVTVSGGSPVPSGIVNITGANTNCTITLSASGTGSCAVVFTSSGTKTLLATYVGDNFHFGSLGTASHQVLTSNQATAVRTPTRVFTPLPPPPLLVINEFVPRPGHDWNLDGVINVGDEYIEILNHGVIDVNLSGYSLDDEVNVGSAPYRLPTVTLKPGERRVFYGSETGLLLSDGGDGVRLLKPNGQLMDAYNYFVVRFPDQSYCRLPDNGGADDWNQNCFPTPGLQNSLSGSAVNPPTEGDAENLCPIADTLPDDFVFAECRPFGNNIWNAAYWDRFGWYGEKYLPKSPGKWSVFVD